MENLTLQREIVKLRESNLLLEKETLRYKKIATHLCFWVSFVSILIFLALALLVNFPAVSPYKTIIYITMGICCLAALFTSSMFEVLYQGIKEQKGKIYAAEYHLNKAEEELARI